MIIGFTGTFLAPRRPRFYTGKHRAVIWFKIPAIRLRSRHSTDVERVLKPCC